MMIHAKRRSLACAWRLTLLGAVAGSTSACNDPRYHAAQERHNRSIDKVVNAYNEDEATRNQRMHKTLAVIEKDANERPEKLRRTVQKIEADSREREEKRKRMQPVWEQRFRDAMDGDMHNADETFARMFY